MTPPDYGTFEESFKRVATTFRLKLKSAQFEELTRNYFKILESAAIEDVLAGAQKCLATCRRFPTPAEWLLALPVSTVGTAEAKDIRVMSAEEQAAYARAERLHYEDAACDCLLCQAANVTHRPLRFVPDFYENGEEMRAFDQVRQKVVVAGHWAHGEELARWYFAKAACFASVARNSPMRGVLSLVGRERDPGQEG